MQHIRVPPLPILAKTPSPRNSLTPPPPSRSAVRPVAKRSGCTRSSPSAHATFPSAAGRLMLIVYSDQSPIMLGRTWDARRELPQCDRGVGHQSCRLGHPWCFRIFVIPPSSSILVPVCHILLVPVRHILLTSYVLARCRLPGVHLVILGFETSGSRLRILDAQSTQEHNSLVQIPELQERKEIFCDQLQRHLISLSIICCQDYP